MKRSIWWACFTVLSGLISAALAEPAKPPAELTVVSFNLENYVMMERGGQTLPKPDSEKAAVVNILKKLNPDVLGVCEMGDKTQLDDLQKRLADAGLKFVDSELVISAADQVRHVALLSKYPIVARNSVADASYTLDGKPMKVQRGFLDVTIKVGDDVQLRCIGVHLKSKRPVPEGEALMRRNEAHLLRAHVDEILTKEPATKLLVYGDYNDTKDEPPLQEVMGRRNSPMHLQDILLTDDRGERWTHFWKTADQYSRIDYLLVSKALEPLVDEAGSFINNTPDWNDASDHRALVGKIRLK